MVTGSRRRLDVAEPHLYYNIKGSPCQVLKIKFNKKFIVSLALRKILITDYRRKCRSDLRPGNSPRELARDELMKYAEMGFSVIPK